MRQLRSGRKARPQSVTGGCGAVSGLVITQMERWIAPRKMPYERAAYRVERNGRRLRLGTLK